MCGIAGFFDGKRELINFEFISKSMGDMLAHRGPDNEGYWVDKETGLSFIHRRLSIIDLSMAGHQPMQSKGNRFAIVFNGEIYNHTELRSLLNEENRCLEWYGHSDTETLLACFDQWGIDKTLSWCVGMFAIALYDKKTKILYLMRDRAGEKPLYYGWCGKLFIFGSDIRVFKAHPQFELNIDHSALYLYLRYNYIPAPFTIYSGVRKLPAAHYIKLSLNRLGEDAELLNYWDLNSVIRKNFDEPHIANDRDTADELESYLVESIRGQLVSDAPLGAFLSGGLDSSLIVALMQKINDRPVHTYSIGFHDSNFNEADKAAVISRHLGTEHTELYLGHSEILKVIPDLPNIYSEPFADSSQIPTFLVSKMASEHVKVALSGDAGDELFGGYNHYQFAPKIWNYISCIPYHLRLCFLVLCSPLTFTEKQAKLMEVMRARDWDDFYLLLKSHWKHPEKVVNFSDNHPYQLASNLHSSLFKNLSVWMMANEFQTYMTDDVLVKVDRASMANSLEVRTPFLDHRVIEFAFRLPASMKIRNGQGKWILRQILYKYVPPQLVERPKQGFKFPVADWLRGPLRDWSEALLDEHRIKEDGFFCPAQIQKAYRDHLTKKADNSHKLWGILMFQAWLDNNR